MAISNIPANYSAQLSPKPVSFPAKKVPGPAHPTLPCHLMLCYNIL